MTTRVTVDAHAGWPVKVTIVTLGQNGEALKSSDTTVPPNHTQEFYVHSHAEIHVKEMPRT